jgi:hypothetical protein
MTGQNTKKKQYQVIRLERDGQDHLLPKNFFEILFHQFLPVLALVYIASVIGIAAQKDDVLHALQKDKIPYEMGLVMMLWVSGPAIAWIFMKGSIMLSHVADIWFRILAFLMVMTMTLCYVLFPEGQIYGLRLYFVLTIPIFLIIYAFMVRGLLPKAAAYPLNAIGFCVVLYGALINVVF